MDRNLGTTGYVMIPRALLLKAFDEHHEECFICLSGGSDERYLYE